MAGGVPTLDAAQRAARELLDAGVGTVLLYGSLARSASGLRDIDLVAIYDDVDYAERSRRRCELAARASATAGCVVDVRVTDRPESSFDENYLRRHVSAALGIARLAADRCATNDCIAITPLVSV